MGEQPRWHPDEERFLAKLEQQCNLYYDHFNRDHAYYSKLSSRFNIPILIVSAINALVAVALNSFVEQKYVSVMNAILSAGTGVLGSIQLYMKISEKMTNALRASILMKRLALKISKELSIDPTNRLSDGKGFVADAFSEFNVALEQGNPIERKLDNHLAFTPLMRKEKTSLFGMISGTSSPTSPERLEGLSESRTRRLWSLVDRVRTDARSLPESYAPSRLNDSIRGESTPEELESGFGVRGS